ncbi:NUDIX domain-containing protein [Companilactobacillus crustorum]|uniref:NrtR DNA-binding winged helix domain-containing protein n=1 Tax=Companilactobacillus crustorum TaxID=392416 RepID=UPI00237D3518|nr:NUDIX domain-containing protein [Companilactobacillus crustorum]WDT66254.1 NUDIX domain-containing protein [Companilactobacillus crustorum]
MNTTKELMINVVNIIWSFNPTNKKVLILLVKNSTGIDANKWGLPTTNLHIDENAEQASLRLIKEKIGLQLPEFYTEQLATFSNVARIPSHREIALSYMTYLPDMTQLKPGNGAKDVEWFSVDYLPEQYTLHYQNLTFQTLSDKISETEFYNSLESLHDPTQLAVDHSLILRLAFQRVTNRLNYLPTILLILGTSFTLKQAREVYATFWKEPISNIDNSNFRKTHNHLFCEVGMVHEKSGRPAKLYKLAAFS